MAQAVGLEYIGFRNEQAASYAAGVAGYLTRNPGICLTVSGPGMIHAIAGLANAQVNCWPMILISGANETEQNGMGAFQEAPTLESARLYVKYAARINRVDRIPYFIEEAYRMATYGRPGPVYLEIPADVINAKHDFDITKLVKYQPCPVYLPSTESINKSLDLLMSASKPLVVIGKGAAYAQAEEELKDFMYLSMR
jgi:2-hydroxyacyl-CoA lyase 1